MGTTQDLVVDRVYFSGCWDSNGCEEIKVRRHKCDCVDDVRSCVNKLLRMPCTRRVKVLRFNRFRNCYDLVAVYDPEAIGDEDCEITLPAGYNDRQSVQSFLF